VADITYIRLRAEFVYLAVILDGFSRKVVGWALDTTLATRLPWRPYIKRSSLDTRCQGPCITRIEAFNMPRGPMCSCSVKTR
jgi:hypothetical protein